MPDETAQLLQEPLVLDATVIINFARIKALKIIKDVYGKGIAASEVITEIEDQDSRQLLHSAIQQKWITEYTLNTPGELEIYGALLDRFGKGEAASIALSKGKGFRLATDDLDAREIARNKFRIAVTGSIGILIKAVKMNVVTAQKAEQWHKMMKANGYRSPVATLKHLLE